MARLVERYRGMRILRQDPWECTVAYLCSANNNIPQISRLVERISDKFGKSVELDGEVRKIFPRPERLARDDAESALHGMKLGLNRAANISLAARSVSSGAINLRDLRNQPYAKAKREIRNLPGVGHKISDCIALFSLDNLDAFPVDVHIGRALASWVDCPFRQGETRLGNRQYAELVSWAQQHFGEYAGYAGQFMFCDQPK